MGNMINHNAFKNIFINFARHLYRGVLLPINFLSTLQMFTYLVMNNLLYISKSNSKGHFLCALNVIY